MVSFVCNDCNACSQTIMTHLLLLGIRKKVNTGEPFSLYLTTRDPPEMREFSLVRVLSLAGLLVLASSLTWTMAFRNCRLQESLGSFVGLPYVL